MSLLYTPSRRLSVIRYAVFLFLAAPLVTARYYMIEYDRGTYPIEADDIAIPIYLFTMGHLLTSPFVAAGIWFCIRRYPGKVPLWAWNADRPAWSVVWTSLFLMLATIHLIGTPWHKAIIHTLDIVESLVQTHFLLVLRSAVVMTERHALSGRLTSELPQPQ